MATTSVQAGQESRLVKFMPLIIVGSVLIYAAIAYLLLFMPKIGKFLDGGEYDLRPFETRLIDDSSYIERMEAAIVKYKQINTAHKNKLDLMMPPNEDVPGLFVQLDEIAKKNGMAVAAIDTVVDAGNKSQDSKPVRIAANFVGGSYAEFLQLLTDLESLVRVVDVQSISFTSGTGSYGLVLTAYYVEENMTVDRAVEEVPAQPFSTPNSNL
ncbi:MAG: type 4a pilus biogenesis protein PilO [Patescibacteria group bacterium]